MIPTISCEKRNLFQKCCMKCLNCNSILLVKGKFATLPKENIWQLFAPDNFTKIISMFPILAQNLQKSYFKIHHTYICCHMSWSRTLACDFTKFFSNFPRKNISPRKPISYESALTFHIFQLLRIWESHFYENIFWHLSMSEDITKLRSCYINT